MDFTDLVSSDISGLERPTLISDYPTNTEWLDKYKGMLAQNVGGNTSFSAKWNSGDFMSDKPMIQDFATPNSFDPDREGLTRFQSSDYFGDLGFVAGQNNEELYGQVQTTGDIMSNAFAQMWGLTKYQFKDQLLGWGRLFDFNPVGEDMEEVNQGLDDIMNKNPIFMTEQSKNSTFNWAKFGNIVGQSGFTLGAVGEILFEELILTAGTTLTGGALAPLQAARTAQLTGKLAAVFSKRAGQALLEANRVSDAVLDVDKARNIFKRMTAKAADYTPFTNTLQFGSKGLRAGETGLAATARGFGAFYRDLREANAAFTEARAESAGTYVEMKEQLFDQYAEKNGRQATGEVENIDRIAKEAAHANFLSNAIIIGASNKIQFDNLFKGFKGATKFMGETGNIVHDAKGFFKKGANLRSLKYGVKTAPIIYFKNNITEGVQESLQSVSNEAVKSWYTNNYFNPESKTVTSAVREGIKSQVSQEGLDTFLAGFVTGSIAGPIQGGAMWAINRAGTSKAQRQQRNADITNRVAQLNQYFTFNDKRNLAVQVGIANKMAEAAKTGNKKEFYDLKDASIRSFVRTGIETNKLDAIFDQLQKSVTSLTPEEFRDAYGMDADKQNVLSSIQEVKAKAEDIKTSKEDLDFKYPTSYNRDEMLSAKAYEEAKWQLAFMKDGLTRVRTRQNNLLIELQKNIELSQITHEQLRTLADKSAITSEIKRLKEELKIAENPEKRKQLELLTLIKDNTLSPLTLRTYFKMISDKDISEESMANAFESLKDYALLSEDEVAITRNLDFVADPNNMIALVRAHETVQETKIDNIQEEIQEAQVVVPTQPQTEVEVPTASVLTEEEKAETEEVAGEPVRKNLLDLFARRSVFENEGTRGAAMIANLKRIQNEVFTGDNAATKEGDWARNQSEKDYFGERSLYWVRVNLAKKNIQELIDNLGGNTVLDEFGEAVVAESEKLQDPEVDSLIFQLREKMRVNGILEPETETQSGEVLSQVEEEEQSSEPVVDERPEEAEPVEAPVVAVPAPAPVAEQTSSDVTFSTIRNEILNWSSLPKGLIDKDGNPLPFLETEDYAYFTNSIIRDLFSEGVMDEYQFRLFKDRPEFYTHEQAIPEKDRFNQGTYRYEGERTGLVIFLMDKQGNPVYFGKNRQITTSDKGYKLAFFLPSTKTLPTIAPIRERLEKKLETSSYVQLELNGVTKGVLDQSTTGKPSLDFFESIKSDDSSPLEDRMSSELVEGSKKSYEVFVTTGKGLNKIYLRRNKANTLKYEGQNLNPVQLLETVKGRPFPNQQAKNIAEYLNEVFATLKIQTFSLDKDNSLIDFPEINTDVTYAFSKRYFGNDTFFVHYLNEKDEIVKKRVSYKKMILENSSVNVIPIKTPQGKLTSVPVNVRLDFKAELPDSQQDTQVEPEVSTRIQTIEELEAERDEQIRVLEEEKDGLLKALEEIEQTQTIQETQPDIIKESSTIEDKKADIERRRKEDIKKLEDSLPETNTKMSDEEFSKTLEEQDKIFNKGEKEINDKYNAELTSLNESISEEVEEVINAAVEVTLTEEEKQIVSEVYEENKVGDESQDEFLLRQINEETPLKGSKKKVSKFRAILKKILGILGIVGLFYTAGNPVADFMGRKGLVSREKTQFVLDLARVPSKITEKSFSEEEKQVMYAAIKTAESKGKSYVNYTDYPSGNEGIRQVASTTDKEGENITGNSELTVKRTLGQFTFAKVGGNYVISDKYNFNDAGDKGLGDKVGDVVAGFADESLSTYAKIRKIATNFGSKEGEGADVTIELPIVGMSPIGAGSGPIASMMSIGLLGFFRRKREKQEPITPEDIQALRDRLVEIDKKIDEIRVSYQAKIDALRPEEKVVTLPQDVFDSVVEFLEKNGVIIEKNCK